MRQARIVLLAVALAALIAATLLLTAHRDGGTLVSKTENDFHALACL